MFYLVIFLILTLLSVLNIQFSDKLTNQVLVPFASLILIAVAGLRYETGGDWDSYTDLFNDFPRWDQIMVHPGLLFAENVEEGFVLLCTCIKALGGNIQHLFFVVTTINITLISIASYRYTKYPLVALMCYFGILYMQLEMIYIRQATAVALCFFALQYIDRKSIWKYMTFILLACLFHRVSVLMIPLYFVLGRKFPTWMYLAVIGIGAALMLIGIPWIKSIFLTVAGLLGENYADKADLYVEESLFAVSRKLSIGFILNILILIVVMIFHDQIDSKRYGTVMLNMYFLSLVLYYYCYELVEVSNRTRYFFFIGVIILLPMILELFPLFMQRFAALVVIALYCFSFSRAVFLEQPWAAAYNPYQNYIEYKIHPRPSTGKQRAQQSHEFFRGSRKN